MGARETRVVVVGAGPAGLVTSIVLARYGVPVLLVDKHEPSPLARALSVSMRSMEILRSWGLEDAVRAGGAEVEPRAWAGRTLASQDGVEIPLGAPTAGESAVVSPTRPAWVPQHHLERVLEGAACSYPELTIMRGVELVELERARDEVVLVLRDLNSGDMERVATEYVVGADGAHSVVREQLGLKLVGPDDLGEYHRIEFRADLSGLLGARRFGLYVLTHPDATGVLVLRGPDGYWGFNREWHEGEPRMVDQSDDWVVALIQRALGDPSVPVTVERSSTFAFAAQIADRYRAGRGFVVGDAAHRMTPRGGTGMNTAIQDGFDLGWKLAWVLQGWAREQLLETYESERRPVGEHNVARSAQPDGAGRDAAESFAWDLAGRVPHLWVDDARTVSTLDLVGPGLTHLAGPSAQDGVPRPRGPLAPLVERRLDARTADALGLAHDGVVALRPDGKFWSPPVVVANGPGPVWPLAAVIRA